MANEFKRIVDYLVTLNDCNLAEEVKKSSDVQWCLSELRDILEVLDSMSTGRLIELSEADKDERIILLPRLPVDKIYVITEFPYPRIQPCTSYATAYPLTRGETVMIVHPMGADPILYATQEDIGKTIFRTYEEAKRALDEMEERM